MNKLTYVCPQTYSDTNLQGSNYCYSNRQMNNIGNCCFDECTVNNTGCINNGQQNCNLYATTTTAPDALCQRCNLSSPCSPNLICCNAHQQDPCFYAGKYECKNCCREECCCPNTEEIIREIKKRHGCPGSRFERWKTVYQETTDNLGRSILRDNITCRRKIVYPRRCLICDSADRAMNNECLSKIIYPPDSLDLRDVQNCTDYCTGDYPARPPPPMQCMTEDNCYRERPTYHNDLKKICNKNI